MWLPSYLYEPLPVLYAGAGIAGVAVTDAHPLSIASALLLVAAGLYTWLMRREYRGFYGPPGACHVSAAPSRGARASSRR